ETVEDVSGGDREDQRRKRLLIVVAGSFVSNLIGHPGRPVAKPRDGPGGRPRGPLRVGGKRGIPPSPPGKEALVGFACLFGVARARVNACAAAIDLARTQMNESKRLRRHAAFLGGGMQGLYGLHGVWNYHRGVFHSCLHDGSPFEVFICLRKSRQYYWLAHTSFRKEVSERAALRTKRP